jgi:hypothetical protein
VRRGEGKVLCQWSGGANGAVPGMQSAIAATRARVAGDVNRKFHRGAMPRQSKRLILSDRELLF